MYSRNICLKTFPQLTVFTKILWIVMVITAQLAYCTVSNIQLQSSINMKFIQVMPNGRVFANGEENNTLNDIISRENISFANGIPRLRISFYSNATKMYICFNKHWKLIGRKKLCERCLFYEETINGFFYYRSVEEESRKIGFYSNGKPVNYLSSEMPDSKFFQFYKVHKGATSTAIARPKNPLGGRRKKHRLRGSTTSTRSPVQSRHRFRHGEMTRLKEQPTHSDQLLPNVDVMTSRISRYRKNIPQGSGGEESRSLSTNEEPQVFSSHRNTPHLNNTSHSRRHTNSNHIIRTRGHKIRHQSHRKLIDAR